MESWEMPTNWIWNHRWDRAAFSVPSVYYFRKAIVLKSKPVKAVLKISADTRFRFFVNGESVAFGPCRGDYYTWHYDEVEAAGKLHAGENILAATVLRYPQRNGMGSHALIRTSVPGLYMSGQLTYSDGSTEAIGCDETWKGLKNEGLKIRGNGAIWDQEDADGRFYPLGWLADGFDDSHWDGVQPYISDDVRPGRSPRTLEPRPVPALFETTRRFQNVVRLRSADQASPDTEACWLEMFEWSQLIQQNAPVRVPTHTRVIIELNAGELTTGFLELAVLGGKNATIEILTAESYFQPGENGELTKYDRAAWETGCLVGKSTRYRVAGYGIPGQPERYEPFWYQCFRFIQLTVHTQEEDLVLGSFTYRETGYPLEVKTNVETSDGSLAPVWDISLRTLRRCMHETYADCPFHEQLQYAMDSRSQILFTYFLSGDGRLARRCLRDFHNSRRPEGLLCASAPSYETNIIPGFSIYWIAMLYDYLMFVDDKPFVESMWNTVDGILAFFQRNLQPNGLLGVLGGFLGANQYWSYIDWTKEWRFGTPNAIGQGCLTMENLLYLMGLKYAARLADSLDRQPEAAGYRARAQALIHRINTLCRDVGGIYTDGAGVLEYSQHTQVFAVLTGCVQGDCAKRLMTLTMERKDFAQCSVAMYHYLFRALENTGLYALADTLWESYRIMVNEQHLTTCVEEPVHGRSDCHAWGAVILYELPAVTMGVRPIAPGFQAFEIAPVPGYLDWAKGTVTTPGGPIGVRWQKEASGHLNLEIDDSACSYIRVQNASGRVLYRAPQYEGEFCGQAW